MGKISSEDPLQVGSTACCKDNITAKTIAIQNQIQKTFLQIFLKCGPFLKYLLNLLQYCFCFMFSFFGCDVCGIFTP